MGDSPGETILPNTLASAPRVATTTPGEGLELLSVLGRGGMGVVWTAQQRSLERVVAVKRLSTSFDAHAVQSLLAEARTTGALEHPGIVPVHELRVDADGSPLLVMKRVEGVTLGALLADPTHSAWNELERRHGDRLTSLVDILMRVSDALEFAHQRGVIHRDVKSDNVMVGAFGEVYLLDWGIALRPLDAPETVELAGTPAYMAPEMVRGEGRRLDARTDVYLLGATLHHVLTGRPRHEGATVHAVLLAASRSETPTFAADVPEPLASLVRRATSADAATRPSSAAAFRDELAAFLRHRASNRLVDDALPRLTELERDGVALNALEVSQALTETRFGLSLALREWPQNVRATDALERALVLAVRVELARQSPESAAALLRELRTPPPALVTAVQAAQGELSERARLAARAARDATERDASLSSTVRLRFAALFIAVLFGLLALAPGGLTYAVAFGMDLVFLTSSVAVLFASRAGVMVNRWSRDAVALFLLAALGTTLSHGIGWLRHDDLALHGDSPTQVALAVLFGLGSRVVDRRLVFAAVVGCLAAVVSARWPALSLWGSAATALVAVLVLAFRGAR